ncbi:MAG: DUF1405 domain-containing protein [Methanobacteriota archaeon]
MLHPSAVLRGIRDHGGLAWPLVALNLGGVAFGFWYYAEAGQFAATPAALWVFVPDSPLAVLYFALALGSLRLGFGRPWLTALAAVANVQVGLWTTYVLVRYADGFGTWDPSDLNFYLLFLHLGMVAQAFVLAGDLSPLRGWGLLVPAWFLAHWAMDYLVPVVEYAPGCVGTRPITVPCEDDGILPGVSLLVTLVALAAVHGAARNPRPKD